MREMQEALAAHEGCNLYGSLPVPRVAGDIHVTANTQSGMILRQARGQRARLTFRRV